MVHVSMRYLHVSMRYLYVSMRYLHNNTHKIITHNAPARRRWEQFAVEGGEEGATTVKWIGDHPLVLLS